MKCGVSVVLIPEDIVKEMRDELKVKSLSDVLYIYKYTLGDFFKSCLVYDSFEDESVLRSDGEIVEECIWLQNGFYNIKKSFDGESYGYYLSLEDACSVRDELVKCGWDKCMLNDICCGLGVFGWRY